MASQLPQTDEMANKVNMKKNINENRGLTAIALTASGYTMKAKPGPASTTLSMAIPFLSAIKPNVPKTTNPVNIQIKINLFQSYIVEWLEED